MMAKDNVLGGARSEIDRLDSELIRLFSERMAVSREIAGIKRDNNLSIFDAEREKYIIDRAADTADEQYIAETSLLMRTILALGKSCQRRVLFAGDQKSEQYLPEPEARKTNCVSCAYQGLPGAWGEQAALQVFPDAALENVDCFEDVFTSVRSGKADYGVLPIENSQTGAIGESYDLLRKYGCYIGGKTEVEIRQCLLALPDTELADVRKVFSHPEGFKQCRRYLHGKHWQLADYANTAMAAKAVLDSADKSCAAIGSREAARHFGLKVLEPDIMDTTGNTTAFIIIASKPEYTEASNHVSLSFSVIHRSGALCEVLMPFMAMGIDLMRIESRPGGKGSYRFFAEIEGNIGDGRVLSALRQAEMASEYFEVTGCYMLEGGGA